MIVIGVFLGIVGASLFTGGVAYCRYNDNGENQAGYDDQANSKPDSPEPSTDMVERNTEDLRERKNRKPKKSNNVLFKQDFLDVESLNDSSLNNDLSKDTTIIPVLSKIGEKYDNYDQRDNRNDRTSWEVINIIDIGSVQTDILISSEKTNDDIRSSSDKQCECCKNNIMSDPDNINRFRDVYDDGYDDGYASDYDDSYASDYDDSYASDYD